MSDGYARRGKDKRYISGVEAFTKRRKNKERNGVKEENRRRGRVGGRKREREREVQVSSDSLPFLLTHVIT